MDTDNTSGSILVGVDGSDHANRAVVWAAEQADRERRPLVVVHGLRGTLPLEVDWFGPSGGAPAALERARSDTAQVLLDEAVQLATSLRPGTQVRPLLARDDPREVLIAASRTAHLVVVGSHGRSVWRSLAMGSVSSAVSRHAACPVVVTHAGTSSTARGVLVGADGTTDSLPVIEFAFRQACLQRTPLTVMHCYWDVAGQQAHGRLVGPEEPGLDDLRLMLSESVAGFCEKFPDVTVDLQLARGLVDLALTEGSPSQSLVVVGRRDTALWSRLLYGSATTAVLEHARGTVAVVPEPTSASAH
ncbi:MAG: universal stress protein [Nocardioides sp.]